MNGYSHRADDAPSEEGATPGPLTFQQQQQQQEPSQEEASSPSSLTAVSRPSHSPRRLPLPPMASSRGETLFLSSAGDVLTTRCRHAPYPSAAAAARPYEWTEDVAALCCEAAVGDDAGNLCSPWTSGARTIDHGGQNNDSSNSNGRGEANDSRGGGLLGGAPAAVGAAPLHDSFPPHNGMHSNGGHVTTAAPTPTPFPEPPESDPRGTAAGRQSPLRQAQKAFRSPPIAAPAGFDADSIIPIQSFDYSHIYDDGGSDMAPAAAAAGGGGTAAGPPSRAAAACPPFWHGVPTFLSHFCTVRIRTVSAHPLGAHVLLISHGAGLLYAYGLNTYGQLGLGVLSDARGIHQGYIMRPTIVTPLIEHGGKAVACAAGVSHSLVVVETEERRLVPSRSFDSAAQHRPGALRSRSHTDVSHSATADATAATEAVVHHQMYGFGRNDFLKIGLVSPKRAAPPASPTAADEMEPVLLPRRVALRCAVQRPGDGGADAAAVSGIFAIAAAAEHSAALVRRPSGDVEVYTWGNATYGALGLPPPPPTDAATTALPSSPRVVPVPSFVACLSRTANTAPSLLSDDEYPVNVSLSRCCSFVVTSAGRCFSFGMSEDGMLGLGRTVTEVHQPTAIALPAGARSEQIVSVSAGAGHVVACTDRGHAYAWGARSHAGLEIQPPVRATPQARSSPVMKSPTTPAEHAQHIQWAPKRVEIPLDRTDPASARLAPPILQACAGYDCSFFVAETGKVYATGKNSGRLGLGELEADVPSPKSLFGGLQLFQQPLSPQQDHARLPAAAAAAPKPPVGHRLFRRGLTVS